MSRKTKDIIAAIKLAKRKDKSASVRSIAENISKTFDIIISKSSVSDILNKSGLSSPVGRRVSGKSLNRVSSPWAGYFFFWGADALLGLSKSVAQCFRRSCPSVHMSERTLHDTVAAWLLAKVIYSVDLSRAAEYEKDEMWPILGRRIAKGLLTRFLDAFNSLQLIKNEIVTEIAHLVQDVHRIQFDLEDKSVFSIDASFKTIWDSTEIPIDFCSTYCNINSYIDDIFVKNEPVVVFSARAESELSELLAEFVFSLNGSSPCKKIRRIRLISPKGVEVKEVTHSGAGKINFIIGIWPWQYKPIRELEKKRAMGYAFSEVFEQKYPWVEEQIRFAQHIDNKEVKLRLILIKEGDAGHARIALFTNMDAEDHSASEVVGKFVRRFPFFEEGHRDFLDVLKDPAYADEFPDDKKILERAQAVRDSRSADEIFGVLVDVLNLFMQRSFFPSSSWGWSLLKTRELFLKVPGRIRRDYADDIFCNLLPSNKLRQVQDINTAALRLNEQPIFDADKNKIWMRVDPQAGPGVSEVSL